MPFKDFDFQNNALNKLYDTFISNNRNVVFQAPTGSGKTAVLIKLMDRILENSIDKISFVWLTPGAGELEEQSWEKTSKNATFVKANFLQETLISGFQEGTVTFLNWEIVNRKGNIVLKDGEKANLIQTISSAKEQGIKFILMIDEEHKNQTDKAQKIIDFFDAQTIFRASATPIEDKNATKIKISEEDVIAEGLITRNVYVNDQFMGTGITEDLKADDQEFLDAADRKRSAIRQEYRKRNININPLVLIQFPDEKNAEDEVLNKIELVKDYLVDELGQDPDNIAVWLSGKRTNVEGIEENDSKINYLLMKQAVSTGWDAPRAKILVKLRLNTSKRFTIQTIGRIRRMPEQRHYDIDILDNSFVYSNDEVYVLDIIKNQMGSGLTQMGLKPEVDQNTFNIVSYKRNELTNNDLSQVAKLYREQFKNEFKLTNNAKNNVKKLKEYGFVFGTTIFSDVPSGKVTKLEDFVNLDTIRVEFPIVDTRQWGYRYDAVMKVLQPYFHVGNDLKNIRAIIADLFAYGDPGSEIEPLLQLRPKERYAFIINNAKRLKESVKAMDARQSFAIQQNLFSNDFSKRYLHVPLLLKTREGYLDSGIRQNMLHKNVYQGYSESNWIKQSNPEKMFESQIETMDTIQWLYRSKDHGDDYFSIPYNGDTKDFFPDYLLKSVNGLTYIVEVKGAQGQNIDEYAEAKFNALKDYIKGLKNDNLNFAFVRPSTRYKDILMFNNTYWDEIVDDSPHWKPITELFVR